MQLHCVLFPDTAAIVVPILLILLVCALLFAGFVYFRRRKSPKAFAATGPVAFRSGTNVEFGGTGLAAANERSAEPVSELRNERATPKLLRCEELTRFDMRTGDVHVI